MLPSEISLRRRLRWVRVLALVSIPVSALSYFTVNKLGIGELYPFYSYFLYLRPPGTEGFSQYRIYVADSVGGALQRQTLNSHPALDPDLYSDLLQKAGDAYVQHKDTIKLHALRRWLYPQAAQWALVREDYSREALMQTVNVYRYAQRTTLVRQTP